MPTISASRRCLISRLLSRIDLAANLMHIQAKQDVSPSVSHMTAGSKQKTKKKDEKCRFNIHLHEKKLPNLDSN